LQRTRIEGIVVESIVARRLRRRNRARLHTARLRPRAEEVLEEAVVRRVGRAHCCVEAALLLLLLLRRLLLRALSRTQSGAGTNVIGTRDGVEAEHRVQVGHAACAGRRLGALWRRAEDSTAQVCEIRHVHGGASPARRRPVPAAADVRRSVGSLCAGGVPEQTTAMTSR
jgi:hypothetical protein